MIAMKPKLWFTDTASTITHWSVVDSTLPATPNPSLNALSVECSIHGGCPLTI